MAGGQEGGVMNWEIGIDIYTLICIKWITNKNLLYKKINKIKFKKKKRKKKYQVKSPKSPQFYGENPLKTTG